MLDKDYIEDITPEMENEKVKIAGWVYRQRSHGGLAFIVLRDSTGIIQSTIKEENVDENSFNVAQNVGIEASVIIEGVVKKDDRAPTGIEVQAENVELVGESNNFPIEEDSGKVFKLDNRHLDIRSRENTELMELKELAIRSAREWLWDNKWHEVFPPLMNTAAVEGGSTLFRFDYFDEEAYLSQSAQLYLEVAMTSLEKVWALTPSFRAEKSRTRRHITEYWHLELEAPWMDMDDILEVQENLVSHMTQTILNDERGKKILDDIDRDLTTLENTKAPFERITYTEAIELLQEKGIEIEWGEDMGAEEERELTMDFKAPFFVTKYPKHAKAFYMKENPDDPETVLAADLLAPEGYGEIIGGSEREDDLEKLIEMINWFGYEPEDYEWYLDLRRYGSVPHSGFGMGLERYLNWLGSLSHIRKATLMPRTPSRIYP